jgi:glycosyltransferase involved in cell wall biosynthesis
VTGAPRLSIGLPVYNGDDYLGESLDALLGQTFDDFELIISDNASTDGTADICHRYEKQDSRIRYIRQPHNIGLAPNHNFVFQQSRGELFKWAAADDLYARDLLRRCVDALDEYPDVVLAHSWEAAIDDTGQVTQALEYPLATDSLRAPERFRGILFGSSGLFEDNSAAGRRLVRVDNRGILRACDEYGVIRADVLRRVAPLASYHHSDRIVVCEIALHGRFHMTPDWLYFRRDYPDRTYNASPSLRARCAILDPARGDPRPKRWPSTCGDTWPPSGARRCPPRIAANATATWPTGWRIGLPPRSFPGSWSRSATSFRLMTGWSRSRRSWPASGRGCRDVVPSGPEARRPPSWAQSRPIRPGGPGQSR